MENWKILIADGLDESGQAVLSAAAQVDNFPNISPAELLNTIDCYDAVIVRSRTKVTAEVIQAATNLKVVGRAGVGVDNIDLAAARQHNVRVVNTPQSTSLAVAELTMALLLSTARMVPLADAGLKNGKWLKKQLEGVELSQKVLGIIGIGNIGAAVARRAAAFGMQILAYDIARPASGIDDASGAELVTLDELLARSDYISLHIPLTDSTRYIINAETLAKAKPGVRLVCAARGGVIDESALLQALNNGQVAAAALDVFEHEPPGLSDLVAHPSVICTPHIGAQTQEAQGRAAQDIATEVLAALNGAKLRWQVA